MEISEGMYVKYIRGMINGYVPPKIAKATDCSDKDLIKIDNGQVILRNDILKASYNIIDLIEVGDYVNGDKVIRIETSSYPEDKNVKIIVCCGDDDYYLYYNEDIKTILTKEQYENNCYKGEE